MSKILALLFFVFGMGVYRYYFPDFGILESAISGGVLSAIGFVIGSIIDYIRNKVTGGRSQETSATVEVFSEPIKKNHYGFGGWLIVYFIGLTYQFYGNIRTGYINYNFTKTDNFKTLITPGSDSFNSFWEITIYFEIFAAVILSLLTISILYFCIRKSKYFKIFSIIFISTMLITNVIDLVALLLIQNGYTETMFEHPYDGTYKSFVYAIVWIPYFIFSRRVKNTYVN